VVASDVALARLLSGEGSAEAAPTTPVVGLLGGDLCRTLGGRGAAARLRSDGAQRLPVDVGTALVDGEPHRFVAHLVARRRWWRGEVVAVMNAAFLGRWNVAPRAHPGDGRLDVLEARLPFADRVKAWRRLPTGTHVPHPDIRERRLRSAEWRFDPPVTVWIDGEPVGRCRHLVIGVEPDRLEVVV
jgi:diacylglycerol kinase family enzyme